MREFYKVFVCPKCGSKSYAYGVSENLGKDYKLYCYCKTEYMEKNENDYDAEDWVNLLRMLFEHHKCKKLNRIPSIILDSMDESDLSEEEIRNILKTIFYKIRDEILEKE